MTADPLRGEMMLRPDFTVPVVQAHMAHGADPARYCYMGEVFRKQDTPGPRASEYLQVGFELFDRAAPEQADAEVFALFSRLLAPLSLRAATGDIGILMAAVRGLSTSDRRKAALLRHIWRPNRFRALLDRFSGRAPLPAARAALLEHLQQDTPEALITAAGTHVGLRSPADIAARARALIDDAATAPIAAPEAALLYDLLSLQAPARAALSHLRGITPHAARHRPGGGPFRHPARRARRAGNRHRLPCRSRPAMAAPRSNITTASSSPSTPPTPPFPPSPPVAATTR